MARLGSFLPISKPETGKDPGTAMTGSCQRVLPCPSFISVAVIKFPSNSGKRRAVFQATVIIAGKSQ